MIRKDGCVRGMKRMELAREAFRHTSVYDEHIAAYLSEQIEK